MATKTRLSRTYVYAPFDEATLNFDLAEAELHNLAFMADPTAEPSDEPSDWHEAMVVTEGHPLFDAIGSPALAMLVGPLRGDTVTDPHIDLPASGPLGHLVWSDIKHPDSDERLTDWHGPLTVIEVA